MAIRTTPFAVKEIAREITRAIPRVTRWMLLRAAVGVYVTGLAVWTRPWALRSLSALLAIALVWTVMQPHDRAAPAVPDLMVAHAARASAVRPGAHPGRPALHPKALATAEAQGRARAHARWLQTVYLPRLQHRMAQLQRTAHKARRAVAQSTAISGFVSGDAALIQAIYQAFSAYAEPYATPQIAAQIVAEAAAHGVDAAIVAGLFLHEDGSPANRALFPDHMNRLLYNTRNLGNIKCYAAGRGCYAGFQQFASYAAGIDGFFELWDYYRNTLGVRDFQRFVAIYAPPNADQNGPVSGYESDVQAKAQAILSGW